MAASSDDAWLRRLIDAIGESVALLDREGRILVINATGAGRLGAAPESLKGQIVYALLPEAIARSRRVTIEKVMRTGKPAHFVDRRLGTYYANSVYPLPGADGSPCDGVAIVGTDVYAQWWLEAGRRDPQSKLRLVFDRSDYALSLAKEGRHLLVNRSYLEMFGHESGSSVIGKPIDLDILPEERPGFGEHFRCTAADECAPGCYETRARRRDGSVLEIDVKVASFSCARDGSCVLIWRDIGEQRRAVAELSESLAEIEMAKTRAETENGLLRQEVESIRGHGNVVAESAAMRKVMAQIGQVAPTDSTVLLQGETGTGKEMLAWAIQRASPRRGRAMIVVNCAAMSPALIESELFGHEKGAYTGAFSRQIGRFETAHGGTIFLDEISELPRESQGKLLRVLQEGEIERLGGTRTIKVDVRVIAASNRDLAREVAAGHFRSDLFYRLNVFPIHVPPLRQRQDDLAPLVRAFVRELGARMGKKVEAISAESLAALRHHQWPGNVRELHNLIERAMIQCGGTELSVPVPSAPEPVPGRGEAEQKLHDVQRRHVIGVLKSAGWRVRGPHGAAEILGLKPTTLESLMKRLEIKRPI